jgi:hypothetical protein
LGCAGDGIFLGAFDVQFYEIQLLEGVLIPSMGILNAKGILLEGGGEGICYATHASTKRRLADRFVLGLRFAD